jgi:hypothetical protein
MGPRTPLLVAALLQVACYNYVPLAQSRLTPTTYLAITLTDIGSEELARSLGPDVRVVRGRFVAAQERGLAMSVQAVESGRGGVSRWAGETVVVPEEFVRAAQERRVSRGKMALLAGASLFGMVVAYRAFGPGASGGTPSSAGSGPGAR